MTEPKLILTQEEEKETDENPYLNSKNELVAN